MKKIYLLDCTLRDGGYVNGWNFGKNNIYGFLDKINKTNIECVELGFLKNVVYDENKTLFNNTDLIKDLLKNKNNNILYCVMYDMSSPLQIENIKQYDSTGVDLIRIIFKKHKMKEAYSVCQKIKDLGYKIAVNFVNTDFYTDEEFINGIEIFNKLTPFSIAIVDTFGSMKKNIFYTM